VSRRLVLLADAAPETGVGHYVRSAALATAAAGRGWLVTAALQPDTVSWVRDDITSRGWAALTMAEGPAGFAQACRRLADNGDDVAVVVDSYRVDSAFLADLRERLQGSVVLVVDDLGDRVLHADLVLNQNVGAEQVPTRVDPDTEVLVGPRFALLRPEFAERRAEALAACDVLPDVPRTVLVLMGGTDPTGSAAPTARACQEAFPDAVVTAVGCADGTSPSRVRFVDRITDMPSAMLASDLVVSAGGSTLWELCCLARPMAVLQVAANQGNVYSHLTRSGTVLGLGSTPVEPEDLVALLRSAASEPGTLRRLARAGASLVDGLGAERVTRSLERRLERNRS
jgi:UDP-2,4-diacetamido-2,4,6-trideoxy-beta-L-altropyranose hydrolase